MVKLGIQKEVPKEIEDGAQSDQDQSLPWWCEKPPMLLKPSQSNDNTPWESSGEVRGWAGGWAEGQDGWHLVTKSQYRREERKEIPRGWLQLFDEMNRHEQAGWGRRKNWLGTTWRVMRRSWCSAEGTKATGLGVLSTLVSSEAELV